MNGYILVADEEVRQAEVVAQSLRDIGLRVQVAGADLTDLPAWPDNLPILLVQGVDRPQPDVMRLCRSMRDSADVPVLFLPRRDHEIGFLLRQQMSNFASLPKPVAPVELQRRVRRLLETPGMIFPDVLEHGPVVLRPLEKVVHCKGVPMLLAAEELFTLEMMLRQPTRLFSRESIMIVSYGREINPARVDGHIEELNGKFRAAGVRELIGLVCGVGFVLNAKL